MESSPRSGTRKARGRGFKIGCGCALLCAVGLLGLLVFATVMPFSEARRIGGRLDERFGSAEVFVPSADGSIPAERIEAFLMVRRRLMAYCGELEELPAELEILRALHARGASVATQMRTAARVSQRVLEAAPLAADFLRVRNETLWMRKMGLGEYSYFYLLAYREQLLEARSRGGAISGGDVGESVRRTVAAMLEAQLAGASGIPGGDLSPDLLPREIEVLDGDPDRLPWQDGLPEAVRQSLDPYAEELAASFCEAAVALELR